VTDVAEEYEIVSQVANIGDTAKIMSAVFATDVVMSPCFNARTNGRLTSHLAIRGKQMVSSHAPYPAADPP
jgi:hypothetical protein